MSDEVEVYVGRVAVPDASYLGWQSFCEFVFAEVEMQHRPPSTTHTEVRKILEFYYDDEPSLYRYFIALAATVRKRLLIQGYTFEFCERAWTFARDETVRRYETYSDLKESSVYHEMRALQNLRFIDWLKMLRSEVDASPLSPVSGRVNPWQPRYLLSAPNDVFVQLALLLEAFPDAPVWMDCSFLYDDDADTRSPQNIARDEDSVFSEFPSGKIIVLTEGKSDTEIISAALTAFYPEFSEAYQFLDFEEFRIEGGASFLARMIKVLSSARVTNRMIALFDNDAAGYEAYRSLKAVRFPRNVRLMLLPQTELAGNYPTIGPAGLVSMNVNGAGAPIELYLGRSSLTASDGKLQPVRWSQWIASVERYHGIFQNKDAVSKSFFRSLANSKRPIDLRKEFPEMNHLLEYLFSAFEDHQPPIV